MFWTVEDDNMEAKFKFKHISLRASYSWTLSLSSFRSQRISSRYRIECVFRDTCMTNISSARLRSSSLLSLSLRVYRKWYNLKRSVQIRHVMQNWLKLAPYKRKSVAHLGCTKPFVPISNLQANPPKCFLRVDLHNFHAAHVVCPNCRDGGTCEIHPASHRKDAAQHFSLFRSYEIRKVLVPNSYAWLMQSEHSKFLYTPMSYATTMCDYITWATSSEGDVVCNTRIASRKKDVVDSTQATILRCNVTVHPCCITPT